MKRFWCVFLLGVLCFSYAGCKGGTAQKEPTKEEIQQDIEDQGKTANIPP